MYGVEIQNDGGFTKIDEETEQLVVVHRGSFGVGGTLSDNLVIDLRYTVSKAIISPIDYSSDKYFMLEKFVSEFVFNIDIGYGLPLIPMFRTELQLFELTLNSGVVNHTSLTYPCYFMLLAKISDVEAVNALKPQSDYGMRIYNDTGGTIFSSDERYFEFDTVFIKPKADFLNESTIALPVNAKRNYIDVSLFAKTHYNVGSTEYFSATLGKFSSNESIQIIGKSWAQNFGINNTRTDPGYIEQTFLIGASDING